MKCIKVVFFKLGILLVLCIISSCSQKVHAPDHTGIDADLKRGLTMLPADCPTIVQGETMPKSRSMEEVKRIIEEESKNPKNEENNAFRIVLCASEKDEGHSEPGMHDYPLWQSRWTSILGEIAGIDVQIANQWPNSEQIATADVIVFFHNNPTWSSEKADDLDEILNRGGGLVFLHWSINCYRDPLPLQERTGLVWSENNDWRRGVMNLIYEQHPITRGVEGTSGFLEEPYWNLNGDPESIVVIATSEEDGKPRPQLWTKEVKGGRVFVCLPGHFTWTHDDPLYRLLVFRGICWVGRRPLHSLNEGIFVGSRFH